MDLGQDLLVSVLTSATVASFVAWLTKLAVTHQFDRRLKTHEAHLKQKADADIARLTADLKRQSDMDIEQLKADLQVATDHRLQLQRLRREVLPTIEGMVYRIKNVSRELVNGEPSGGRSTPTTAKKLDVGKLKELDLRRDELQDALYRFRLPLEQDDVFTMVHDYKNRLRSFSGYLRDIEEFERQVDTSQAERVWDKVGELYAAIEEQHDAILSRIRAVADEHSLGPGAGGHARLSTPPFSPVAAGSDREVPPGS